MPKFASVVSLEFETPEEVTDYQLRIAEAHDDLNKDVEQLIVVHTSETSVIGVRVHRDQESRDRYEKEMETRRASFPSLPKDSVRLEGRVAYIFQHSKYFDLAL